MTTDRTTASTTEPAADDLDPTLEPPGGAGAEPLDAPPQRVKRASLRHAAEYAVWSLGRAAIARASHARVRRAGRRLGSLAYRVLPWLRRRTLDNLALALPDRPAPERARLAERSFQHWASYFLELVSIERLSRDQVSGLFEARGWEVVDALEQQGQGYFFTSGHFGSFEMPAFLIQLRYGDLHVVVRPMNNPLVERDLHRIRVRFGARVIYKRGAGRAMLESFRRGGRVGIVADQDPGRGRGLRIPFFGHPAWTSKTLAVLSLRTGAPVLHFRCVPVGEGGYFVQAGALVEPPARRGREVVAQLTRRYLASVEEDVREHPELWLWMHRRWRD